MGIFGGTMPLSLRFVVPLALALAAIAYAVVPLVDRLTFQWFVRDLDARGAVIVQTAQEPLVELMRERRGARQRVLRYFERIAQGQRIYALGFCDRAGKLAYATPALPGGGALRAGRAARGAQLRCCSSPTARCTSRPTRSRRQRGARRADDRARHELRAAAQRGHAQVRAVAVRRASPRWSR